MTTFKYYPTYPHSAPLVADACNFCGQVPAISPSRLAQIAGEKKAVCAKCLAIGRATVPVPSWVRQDLQQAVKKVHPNWSIERCDAYVAERVDELSHTPPVPWLQNNEWPVCGDDFAVFIREVTREQLEQEYGGIDGAKAQLRAILEQAVPDWEQDNAAIEAEMEDLGNFLRVFMFRCDHEAKDIFVVQTA